MRTREESFESAECASAPSPSLHDQILTAFTARLRTDASGGEAVASALSALVEGRRVPKREALVEAVRAALTANERGGEDATPQA